MAVIASASAPDPQQLPLPPGFRFHPTDQELIDCYLKRKIHGGLHPQLGFIPEVDLYSFKPCELPEKSFTPSTDDPGAKVEWYLFVPTGQKYPAGFRMRRATPAGFWKSTGKNRPILHHHVVIGMRKMLVYHLGRAPHGTRTDWVMHEYRLHHHRHIHDTYALCRVFNKNVTTTLSDMLYGTNTYNEGMHSESSGTDEEKEGMQFEFCGANTNKEGMQFVVGGIVGADANKDGIQPVSDTSEDNSCMQFIFDNAWYTNALAEEDNSWMQFTSDDAWYTSADAEKDDSWMQFISNDVWYPSVD